MSDERIVIYDPRKHKSRTDWARVDALTDEEIARAVADDPDAPPLLTDADFKRMVWLVPVTKRPISIRLDEDILRWFKAAGPRYQSRINAVLRAYMVGERAARRRKRPAPATKRATKSTKRTKR